MQPLKNITVVTLEHAIAAPFWTRQLADLVARVIKIERPGICAFARRYDSRVKGLALTLTAPKVVERAKAAQIASARVNTTHEVWAHRQLDARDRWREIGTPDGPIPALPALGQHTGALRPELGLDAAAVRALRAVEAV